MPVEVGHPDLSQHQNGIFQDLAAFRREGQLCDVVVTSREGTQHHAHMAVLCAASVGFKKMLLGPFREADQVQQGQPVEIAASNTVVAALLEYIYGGQLKLELEDSIELLSLADAYQMPQLALGLEAGLRASLRHEPVATALRILQQTQSLHDLKDLCEKKIAANFESCIEHAYFLGLTAGQMARILKREDLHVSREEIVLKGLFSWLNASKERMAFLGVLLQNVDLQSLSSTNLTRVSHLSASMGPIGHDLQREVDEAWRARRKRSASDNGQAFQPRRRCLKHWSPDLGASAERHPGRKVAPESFSMCCYEGAIYIARNGCIMCRKPGEDDFRLVAGQGAAVNGVNDFGDEPDISVSPDGSIFVVDSVDGNHSRLLSFQDGAGKLVLDGLDSCTTVCCSPAGSVYLNIERGGAVGKLVGGAIQPLISSEHLPEDLQFCTFDFFVGQNEVIYICDYGNSRILRLKPSDAEPVVVGTSPRKAESALGGLYVTEGEKIYVTDYNLGKVWAFHPEEPTWIEVLQCSFQLRPNEVYVQGSSIYVNASYEEEDWASWESGEPGIYEYVSPAQLELQ